MTMEKIKNAMGGDGFYGKFEIYRNQSFDVTVEALNIPINFFRGT